MLSSFRRNRRKQKLFSHSENYYPTLGSHYFRVIQGDIQGTWIQVLIELYTVCFSNVYLYSTLTTNSASVSNYNHDVNLFLFMAYWLPSFIPSSIIFEDCFLVFDDMSSPANLGTKCNRGMGSWSTKNQVKHSIRL